MHRIDTSTAQVDKFGVGKNGFTGGNPQTGELPTALNADFFDSLQEEIIAPIEAAGIIPDKSQRNQLLAALRVIVSAKNNMKKLTTSGSFTVPTGVTTIYLSGCAGGGGGGGGSSSSTNSSTSTSGGAGGAGQSLIKAAFTVTPGQVIPYIIGGGGTGGSGSATGSNASSGSAGGSTTFGSLLTLSGGGAGTGGLYGTSTVIGGVGGSGYPAGGNGMSAAPTGGSFVNYASGGSGSSCAYGGGGCAGIAGGGFSNSGRRCIWIWFIRRWWRSIHHNWHFWYW